MEIMGTNFTITLGSWRFRLCFAVEDVDAPPAPANDAPHHVRIVKEAFRQQSHRGQPT